MTKLLDRLYEKDHVWFAVGWILAYVLLMSWADSLSLEMGVAKLVTLPVQLAMVAVLWLWARREGPRERYALGAPTTPANKLLWYVPLVLLLLAKLAFNSAESRMLVEAFLWVASMLCTGFLEEFVFRGLLYRAMDESNHMSAVVVSALTFGMGHIVNLFNASGQTFVETLAQMAFAVAFGFMIVMLLERSGSIWPCIIYHGIFDAISVLELSPAPAAAFMSQQMMDVSMIVIGIGLCLGYLFFLAKSR